MCGITGFYSSRFSEQDLQQMTGVLSHRGPDASGSFLEKKVGLGHRRLSILDLSSRADQPMTSANGRFMLIYNGEVYNFRELTKKLDIPLRTNGDTEVILESIATRGMDCLSDFNGMFAFACYDREKEELWLARDRMGIKPLYYYWNGADLVFASELKSIIQCGWVKSGLEVDKVAVNEFLHLGYIPGPKTIYKQIYKFPAGHYAKINGEGIIFSEYWSMPSKVEEKVVSDEGTAKEKLKELLWESVRYRLISDVPFGTFLSGGIDSSLVTAVASKVHNAPLKTFSIGFKESKFNEAHYAGKVAEHLKTDHFEYILSYEDAIPLFAEMTETYDEPFADSSAVPTMLVSKMARQQVKVALSGDGGDETYLGYGMYNWANRLNNPLIKAFRKPISAVLAQGSNRQQRAASVFDYKSRQKVKSHIFSQEQYFFSEQEIRNILKPQWQSSLEFREDFDLRRKLAPDEAQAFFDLNYYLKDDLLVKVDRASMKYGLEVRVPLLDHRLVEFSLNLDKNLKKKNGVSKYLMKQVLYEMVPERYFDRPKWGFAIPLSQWLKKELKYLVDDFLNREMVDACGMVEYSAIEQLKNDYFKKGKEYLYNRIWVLIILHKWYASNIDQ